MYYTLFEGARNTTPQIVKADWKELCSYLSAHALEQVPRVKKLDYWALVTGCCEGTRAKANMTEMSAVGADIDTAPTDPAYKTFEAMCTQLRAGGFRFIAYSTTNSTKAHNRYRLILPFDQPIDPARYWSAWMACNDRLGGIIDKSTNDCSRLSFLPADWTGPTVDKETKQPINLIEPKNLFDYEVDGAAFLCAADIPDLPASHVRTARHRTASCPHPLTQKERDSLSHDKADDDACWDWIGDIERSPIVCDWMLEKAHQEGSRDFNFLCQVANRAVKKSIPLTTEILASLGEQYSQKFIGRMPPADIARQAENALASAIRNQI